MKDVNINLMRKLVIIYTLILALVLFAGISSTHLVFILATVGGSFLMASQTVLILKDER